MSEYWKSQPKKFCDFCKCWITDNKSSRDFHEKGKRHQEAVKNKIDELKKKGLRDAQKKEEEDGYMKQMEKAALAAFKKDLANDPELAKKYNVKVKPEKEPVFEGPALPGPDYVPQKEDTPPTDTSTTSSTAVQLEKGEWFEAMSDMGYPYYWNTVTGESIWVAPDKYVSLSDQGLAQTPSHSTKTTSSVTQEETTKKEQLPEISQVEDIPLPPGVKSIPLPGETTQSSESSSSSEEEEEEEGERKEDRSARGVYGTWERIRKQEPEQIDLQLPQVESNVTYVPIQLTPDEPKVKFKEKRVALAPSKGSENVTFKKRKLGSGARNVRQRLDDD